MMPTKPAEENPDSQSSPYSPASPSSDAAPPVPPIVPPNEPPAPPAPYGAAVPNPYAAGTPKPSTTLSLLSMIFGIVGVALSCCYGGGFLFSVAAVVLGHLGRRKREPAQGMSTTGLITGYVGVGLCLLWLIFLIFVIMGGIIGGSMASFAP